MGAIGLLPGYLRAVLRHGWFLGLALLGAIGNIITVVGDWNVPRWVWWLVIAIGVVGSQFRAYADVVAELAVTKSRLRELDTRAARLAFYGEAIDQGQRLRAEFEAVEMLSHSEHGDHYRWQESPGVSRLVADLGHFEDTTRATMYDAEKRGWLPEGTGARFDSDEGFEIGEDGGNPWYSRENCLASVDRRLTRLGELRSQV